MRTFLLLAIFSCGSSKTETDPAVSEASETGHPLSTDTSNTAVDSGPIDPDLTDTGNADLDTDLDGDGVMSSEDCDDDDSTVYPGAEEICDGLDNDCNGEIDDVEASGLKIWYVDADSDGYGDETDTLWACEAPPGAVDDELGFDCDDTNENVHPNADEICDAIDNDCDEMIDDEDDDRIGGSLFYIDHDRDGFGSTDYITAACSAPAGYTDSMTDCDDLSATVHPEASERCDGIDNNCDGVIDGDDAIDRPVWYLDADLDGYGDDTTVIASCTPVGGYSAAGGDCNDERADISPGAAEVCDGEDNDCNGDIDDGEAAGASLWYVDSDGDGYGTDLDVIEACDPVPGYSATDGDCDDEREDTFPDAEELCDAIDNDCDDVIDDGLSLDVHYLDMDGDGHGTPDESLVACTSPLGYSSLGDDCHDGSAVSYPGADESCFDAIDNDCDGFVDCADMDGCKGVEPSCWVCGDGIVDPGEDCDDAGVLDGDGCSSTCTSERDLSSLETEWTYDGRQVYVWKSNSTDPIATYDNFCEDRGLNWFTPDSAADAQNTISTLADRDGHHTWIITKNNTMMGSSATWGGYTVSVDSPSCMDDSSSGFSAIRRWGCSMCDPDDSGSHAYSGTTRCWDSGHVYDWLVCED